MQDLKNWVSVISIIVLSFSGCNNTENENDIIWQKVYISKAENDYASIKCIVTICNSKSDSLFVKLNDFFLKVDADTVFFSEILGNKNEYILKNNEKNFVLENPQILGYRNKELQTKLINDEAVLFFKNIEILKGDSFSCSDIREFLKPGAALGL